VKIEELPSKIFHPLLILPIAGVSILILEGVSPADSLKWVSIWILVAMIPPSVVAWNTGEKKGFDVISRQQRNKSYVTGVTCLSLALGIAYFFSAPKPVIDLGIYGVVASSVFGVFNRFTKISIHTGSLSFVAGGFLTIMPPIGVAGVIASVPVGWSRVKLDCHTKSQVIQGAVVGLTSGFLAGVL